MNKDDILDEIFQDDPLNLLTVKKKTHNNKTADERLVESFQEINNFYKENDREPEANIGSISEYQLYSRLKSLREDEEKSRALVDYDEFNLLPSSADEPPLKKELASIDDILNDDTFSILESDAEDLFQFKHTPKDYERAETDFVARRKPCLNFDEYEDMFKQVQGDLNTGKRKMLNFKQEHLKPGDFYVHNGILLFLESVDFEEEVQPYNSGERVRKDGRTRTIFENGTESQLLYRSLYKALLDNGKMVTRSSDALDEELTTNFNNITEEDSESGYLYVLKSKSADPQIKDIQNLYKIGFTRLEVSERIKNAENEPTYLMAPVEYVAGWKCYNLNAQKFELLVHKFFGTSCLEVDVFDLNGKRHTPREWFIAPLDIIKKAVESIIDGSIVNMAYDPVHKSIIEI